MILDVHAHYLPEQYLERLGMADRPNRTPLWGLGMAERIALLDRSGIDAQVLSISLFQPYLPVAADAVSIARLGNDLYAQACAAYPGRFYGFAALPLPHMKESLLELDRCLDQPCMVGIAIGCTVAGHQLDDPIFEPLFAELNRRATTLFVHPVGQAFSDDPRLNWSLGAPMEDAEAALRLGCSGLIDRYPQVKVIIPHLGGVIPFLIARISRSSRLVVAREALKKMWFDTVNGEAAALTCACQVLGSDRLLFGSDFPYPHDEEQFERRLTYIETVGLSAEEIRQIQGARAAALLGIG